MFKILKNQNGLNIVGQMVALALVGIAFYSVFAGLKLFNTSRIKMYKQSGLESMRNQVIQALESEIGLANTIAANASMACVGTHTDCSAQAGASWPIKVMSPDGVLLVDSATATYGFFTDGAPCNTYDSVNGNDACPLRLNVTWRPICGPAPCLNPQNQFVGAFSIKEKNPTMGVNLQLFGFTVYPLLYDSTLESNCSSLGGAYTSADGSCNLPLAGLCPAGQVVLNVGNNNTKTCGFMHPTVVCPAGTAIEKVAANMAFSCKPILTCPPNVGAGRTIWSSWDAWVPVQGSDGGGDGCDGSDGCDGGS